MKVYKVLYYPFISGVSGVCNGLRLSIWEYFLFYNKNSADLSGSHKLNSEPRNHPNACDKRGSPHERVPLSTGDSACQIQHFSESASAGAAAMHRKEFKAMKIAYVRA